MYAIEHTDFYERMKADIEREESKRLAMNWTSLKEWAEYLQAHKRYNQDELARILDDERGYALRIAGLCYCSEALKVLDKTGEKKNVIDLEFKNKGNYYLYIVIKK